MDPLITDRPLKDVCILQNSIEHTIMFPSEWITVLKSIIALQNGETSL
jgi:hypothetical protein